MSDCAHCGTAFSPRQPDQRFCCHGCEFVAGLIHRQGLDRFYELKREQIVPPVRSRPFEEADFSWLAERIAAAEAAAGSQGIAEFDCRVEGISCVGCVWLIAHLFESKPGAVRASADPAHGRLHLEWRGGACDLAGFLRELNAFGYSAGPERGAASHEGRGLTLRSGLCGAFALNAMAFSLPTYLGMPADFEFAGLFRAIAFASATLAMLAGGSYFIVRAVRALKRGIPHIDLPIALGLLSAYAGSIAGWLTGREGLVYFDFVATFVFLMLLGRSVQLAAVERNRLRLIRGSPLAPQVESAAGPLALAEIRPGTGFRWEPGKAAPVASCVSQGTAEASLEWIHGESTPVLFQPGQRVPAGAILLSRHAVELSADESWADSLLSRLLTRSEERGSPLTQRLLQIYLWVVLAIGIAAFIAWSWLGRWDLAWQAAISVFVVSCPCALGVSVPLADELAATRAARSGAFVRHASLWPRLRRVRHVVFDKTGTLTLERPELQNPEALGRLDDEAALALARLTRGSLHPVSRSLLESLGARGQELLGRHGALPVEELPGRGVRGVSDGATWFLGKGASAGVTELRRNDETMAAFHFHDTLRPEALAALDRLSARGLDLYILSGDAPAKVARLAAALGIPADRAHGGLDPAEKARRVQDLDRQDTLYLGDGANDSLAFDAAFVTGTPVVDRSFLEAKADFYSLAAGLAHLPALFAIADARARGVRAAFGFASLYNAGAVVLSVSGQMSPLLAAVLMPLSSLVSLLLVSGLGRSGSANPSSLRSSPPTHEPGDHALRSHLA